ncbi:Cp protein [Rhynchospora pubera]|uniref:Cp protein n=1 Tax=Rhynchospora pubera TaxID=906938 RepID=A0AAV8FS54_9POAL|nr:Cp protein [Rhynchospora pubera]
MEKALTKLSSFTISRKAKEEIASIGEDLSRFSSTVEEKAKWVFEKLKGCISKNTFSFPCQIYCVSITYHLASFLKNVVTYELDESKSKVVVHLSGPCEVSFKDSSIIRYAPRVKATLARGKLSNIEGMKTKSLVWVKVTHVGVESYKSDKVTFTAGVKKIKAKDAYEVPRDAIRIEEF